MTLPVQGTAYTFYLPLTDLTDPTHFLADPTVVAGDFQVSIDGAAFANLSTLPSVEPAGSTLVRVDLSVTEMTNDGKVSVQAIQQSADEWEDVMIFLDVPTGATDSVYDIMVGDHVESSTSLVVNKVGTTTPLVEKDIIGSLLSPSVTIRTTEP